MTNAEIVRIYKKLAEEKRQGKTINPTRIKKGDIIVMRKYGWLCRVEKKTRMIYYLEKLGNIFGLNYHFWKKDWSSRELSAEYSSVFRNGEYLGDINVKYW